ncbi:VOC family protein [Rhizobium sp. BK060]|uniref:VOC family protein n=1 Tax=Rhizobium sp. BK060 TaxID=2587096 RepID=UPI00160A4EAF|nr:VOC family protein [Rhizobium sp. BK060]MBB3396044.1 lactoylglutathione lyase [Rhizobium sp. BK060]
MPIAHVALWTTDLEGTASFMREYFDADVGELYESRRRAGFASRFVALPSDPVRIELMSGPWVEEVDYAERRGWDHIAISLGSALNVDELAARCEAEGMLISAPRTTGDGFYEAVIEMPGGIRIEVTS